MADSKRTIFQDLGSALFTGFDKNIETQHKKVNSYNFPSNEVLYTAKDPAEFEIAKRELSQQKLLANQWVKSGYNLSQQTAMVTSNLKLMYRDADLMDNYPTIGAALDLIMEESCLYSDTYVKLLNGESKTIEELYNEEYKNFWVYSIDENGIDCKPTKIEKVICNGTKPLFKITLDDGTEIKSTGNHKWLLSNNNWIRTDEIKDGESMMSIYDSINYFGYERVISTNGKKLALTHKMVAENIHHGKKVELSKSRVERNEQYQKIVIHHKSFNKLNNDPDQLEYMYWFDHQKLHTDLNTERWNDKKFADKMKKIMSESTKNNWKNNRETIIEKITLGKTKALEKMGQEGRNKVYGKKGEKNPMYGTHRAGKLNPNYNSNKQHIEDIIEEDYVEFILKCNINYINLAINKFNTTKQQILLYNKELCKKYNIKQIQDLKYRVLEKYSISRVKEHIRNSENNTKYGTARILGLGTDQINRILKLNNYQDWNDLVKNVNNHRIIKIEKCEDGVVYDFVNSSNNNCFGVKCNNGQIISHNCTTNSKGQILNITSNSKRIKNILEDLFVNRLDGHINIPMWTRSMAKYGNCFIMLNITTENGIIGARQLPVYEVERMENGYSSSYIMPAGNINKDDSTQFIWVGKNEATPFQNWQIAHFRLLNESTFIPYGVSFLNKARRHWRILTMMEDMMLIYRLERSIERRVFKVFVGNIDDADVPAYLNEIANTIKRMPIIDPQTGQLDLRKNMLDVSQDFVIPVRDTSATSPIETLAAASNLDKIEDLKYIENKVMTALRVPGEFLNYEQSAGNGKNLALKDIRFTRTINRIQQCVIMELTKIALIHLYLNGFRDDLNNFKITMNSPSTQSEILKLEELSKKVNLITDSVRDVGNGMQIMSLTRAQREILGWTDEEISDNMMEIRMERALASELTKTDQIIKRTGFFDKIDKLYGEPNAEYVDDGMGGEPGGDMGGGGSAGGGGFGGGEDTFGGEGGGEEMGVETTEMGGGEAPAGAPEQQPNETPETNQPMESYQRKIDKLLVELKKKQVEINMNRKTSYFDNYIKHLKENKKNVEEEVAITPIFDKSFMISETAIELADKLDKYLIKETTSSEPETNVISESDKKLLKEITKKSKKK